MRTLAVDYGSRRIGLALSDESACLSSPLQVLEIRSPTDAIRQVAEIATKQSAQRLVVGLPLNMDDTIGPAAKTAVRWGRELAAACHLPVVFIDERLSSFAADELLRGQKLTRKAKKQRQDALAAADFLQAFLDGKLKALNPVIFP
ncbi:MAG TPA: Holliday junction resolvase RuvX [Tepidisphaeraceae bacterium]|nr:Holliday junction resolvase RuvX [Tepidisphaeraceae bacterium]